MRFVRMVHPKVEGEAVVPESAVPHHERAGWRLPKPRPEPDLEAEQARAVDPDGEEI